METGIKRDANGRIVAGSAAMNPGGRPVYPDWFKARGDDALRKLLAVMDGKDVDEKISPAMAADKVISRIYGAPPKAPEDTEEGVAAYEALLSRLLRAPTPPASEKPDEP